MSLKNIAPRLWMLLDFCKTVGILRAPVRHKKQGILSKCHLSFFSITTLDMVNLIHPLLYLDVLSITKPSGRKRFECYHDLTEEVHDWFVCLEAIIALSCSLVKIGKGIRSSTETTLKNMTEFYIVFFWVSLRSIKSQC